jgi:hypothetical protein
MTKAVISWGLTMGIFLGSDGFVFLERIEEIDRNEVLPRPVASA